MKMRILSVICILLIGIYPSILPAEQILSGALCSEYRSSLSNERYATYNAPRNISNDVESLDVCKVIEHSHIASGFDEIDYFFFFLDGWRSISEIPDRRFAFGVYDEVYQQDRLTPIVAYTITLNNKGHSFLNIFVNTRFIARDYAADFISDYIYADRHANIRKNSSQLERRARKIDLRKYNKNRRDEWLEHDKP